VSFIMNYLVFAMCIFHTHKVCCKPLRSSVSSHPLLLMMAELLKQSKIYNFSGSVILIDHILVLSNGKSG
jgi:hypothetical protein